MFRNHPLFSRDPTALQLFLYYDEVELTNPLGSKTGKHKLGVPVNKNNHLVSGPKYCKYYQEIRVTPDFHVTELSTLNRGHILYTGKYKIT